MPKISVIIPVYGVEKYIDQCVRSLFEQTLDDIEYIFVDDCTPDRSISILEEVIEEYPHRKPHITILHNDKNLGHAVTRKNGILAASGDFVIHCDSDDWVDTTIYEKLYNKAIEENADFVWCEYTRMDESKEIKKSKIPHDSCPYDVLKTIISMRRLSPLWNTLVKREIVHANDIIWPTWNNSEDMALISQYACKSKKVANIDEHLYFYRMVENSITHDKNKEIERIKGIAQSTQIQKICFKKYGFKDLLPYLYTYQIQIKTRLIHLIPNVKEAQKAWMSTIPECKLFSIWHSSLNYKQKTCFSLLLLKSYPLLNKIIDIHSRIKNYIILK